MSTTELLIKNLEFARARTLGFLDGIEKEPDPQGALSWRPGPGRAHVGWQLMHVAVTEEIFATERLAPQKDAYWKELWPRFRGGSTPDDDVPSAAMIHDVLTGAREHLLGTLRAIGDARLDEIPEALRERKFTIRDVFFVLAWHEAHHQGQAHLTCNLYKASR
ncbi:MAG: DinB family protein [Thermoguttaceae bacterium]